MESHDLWDSNRPAIGSPLGGDDVKSSAGILGAPFEAAGFIIRPAACFLQSVGQIGDDPSCASARPGDRR